MNNEFEKADCMLDEWQDNTPNGGKRGYLLLALEKDGHGHGKYSISCNCSELILVEGICKIMKYDHELKNAIEKALNLYRYGKNTRD